MAIRKQRRDHPTLTLNLDALKKVKLTEAEDLTSTGMSPGDLERFESTDFLEIPKAFKVILFDFESDFFMESKKLLPKGYDYRFPKSLEELNDFMRNDDFQIVVFNYDVNPKAVNQLSSQIRRKFPTTRALITAKAISQKKAELHAQTPSGAAGYYQLPLEPSTFEAELQRIRASYLEEKISED